LAKTQKTRFFDFPEFMPIFRELSIEGLVTEEILRSKGRRSGEIRWNLKTFGKIRGNPKKFEDILRELADSEDIMTLIIAVLPCTFVLLNFLTW